MFRGPRGWVVAADPWNVLEATATSGTTLAKKMRLITEVGVGWGGNDKQQFKLLKSEGTRTDCLALAAPWLARQALQMEVWEGFPLQPQLQTCPSQSAAWALSVAEESRQND